MFSMLSSHNAMLDVVACLLVLDACEITQYLVVWFSDFTGLERLAASESLTN